MGTSRSIREPHRLVSCASWRARYAGHAGPLLGYALHPTRDDRHGAEGIAQETRLRAWPQPAAIADRLTGPRLYAATWSPATGARRAARSRPHAARGGPLELVPAADEARALAGWVAAEALTPVRPDPRRVLSWSYRGLPVAVAAVVLGYQQAR